MTNPSTTSRLQALRIDVVPEVADRQMAAVLRELREAPSVGFPVRVPTPHRSRRRLVAALAATFVLLIPVAAFAAEDSVPGDLLYPVKQSTEWARSLVDPGVAQRHRVQELEIVVDRGAPIDVVTDRFDASVDAVGEQDPALLRRMQLAREKIRERYGVDLGLATSGTRERDSSPRDFDTDNGEGSPSGSEYRRGDGATDPSPTTTTTAVVTETDGGGSGSGADQGSEATTPSTTRSTAGQPEDGPTNGSGSGRP